MFGRRFLAASCAASVVAFASGASFAQSQGIVAPQSQPSADEVAARTLFQQAVAELDAGQFAEAAAHFEESLRRNPAPVAQFNLAFAYRGLGRYLDAVDAVERFLANPGNTPADRVEAARLELQRMRAAVARVRVRVEPEGATVLIDARPGRLRDGAFDVDPGRRVIEVSRVGYRPERREIVLAQGATEELSVSLAVIDTAGRLRVEPSVPGARVSIDGVFVGTGIVERPARMGAHQIEITAEGYLRFTRSVRVGGTGLVRVDATLQRPRPNPWPWLGPTIAVVGVAAASVGGWFIYDACCRPTLDPVLPPDAWGPPLR
ncbi:MAG: PEGA domain-containing protein [Polyangiales bacterium]